MKIPNIKLAKREKIAVYVAAGFIFLFALFQLVFFPLSESKDKLRRAIQVDQKRIEELVFLSSEYNALKGNSGGVGNALTKRGKGFALFSLLEKLASQAGLKDRIKYIKPSSSQTKGNFKVSAVEMQFEAITMKQLFDYLFRVEDPKHVITIKRVSVKNHKDKQGIVDVTIQASTLELT